MIFIVRIAMVETRKTRRHREGIHLGFETFGKLELQKSKTYFCKMDLCIHFSLKKLKTKKFSHVVLLTQNWGLQHFYTNCAYTSSRVLGAFISNAGSAFLVVYVPNFLRRSATANALSVCIPVHTLLYHINDGVGTGNEALLITRRALTRRQRKHSPRLPSTCLMSGRTTLISPSRLSTLLAFVILSAAQSSVQTHIQSAIVVIDTSNNAWHSQVHWLVGTPYLAIKASNVRKINTWIKYFWKSFCEGLLIPPFFTSVVYSDGSRISPRGGGVNPPMGGGAWTRNFAKFSQKLHEIERIWTQRGGGVRPSRPP